MPDIIFELSAAYIIVSDQLLVFCQKVSDESLIIVNVIQTTIKYNLLYYFIYETNPTTVTLIKSSNIFRIYTHQHTYNYFFLFVFVFALHSNL